MDYVWGWIPAFAGMTNTDAFLSGCGFCSSSGVSFLQTPLLYIFSPRARSVRQRLNQVSEILLLSCVHPLQIDERFD